MFYRIYWPKFTLLLTRHRLERSMILNSIDTQFTLHDTGEISWQKDLTNPMPGEIVASIQKGDDILMPRCTLVESDVVQNENQEAVKQFIDGWLERHVATVLEPLFALKNVDDIPRGPAQNIAKLIVAGMGTIDRSILQSHISEMDEEQRNSLRSKKIRFGPLIVYLPALNKPAAVRLRAMLLSLWQDKELPAVVPNDGIVSYAIDTANIDPNYYQAIGYPVYGPRSIRVDMLDRVICAVYDSAKEGKFQAQHQMAEWLGSNIDDLYAILTAMGHKKIEDETPVEKNIVDDESETKDETTEEKPKETKPELAMFWLKRGKAIDSNTSKKPFKKSDKKKSNKKDFKKKEPRKRIYTAEAKTDPADSPFAILGQLKK